MSILENPGETHSLRRPHFLPADLEFDALPQAVQVAIVALVGPLYDALVLGAETELERAMGNSFALLATVELDAQFELGAALNFLGQATPEARAERDRLIDRMVRLVGAKQRTAQFMHRLQALREKEASAGS